MTTGTSRITAPTLVIRRSDAPPEVAVARRRRRRGVEIGTAIAIPVVFVALWELAAQVGWINRLFFPAPSSTVARAVELIRDGAFVDATWVTTYRTLLGFAIGSVLGYLVGVLMGSSRFLRKALEPTLSALYTVPKLAILPVFLTVFGFGDPAIVALVVVTVFFYMWIYTMEAVVAIPDGYFEAARSFGVGGWKLFRHLIYPAILPSVVVGLRISIGVSVLMVIAAEFIVGGRGLGFLIFNARSLFRLEEAYAGIVMSALVGVVLQSLVTWLGRRATPWVLDSGRGAAPAY
jgi:sulfonate transport system permease protein